jgi:hypothetical protein
MQYRMEWKYDARIIINFLARLAVPLVVTVNNVTTCSQVEITDVLDEQAVSIFYLKMEAVGAS